MGGWANLTLVTDDDLGAIEPRARANETPYPWGAIVWPTQRAEAKKELKIWLEAAYPAIKGVADRVLDRHAPDYAFSLIGASYSDITTAAADDQEEDVALGTIFATTANRIYLGTLYQFDGLMVTLLDSLNAVGSVLTVKYWNGSSWTSISATDGTVSAGATFAQTGRVTWTIPSAWTPRRFNGTADEYFWVELSVSVALTAATAATQVLPIRAPDGLKRIAAFLGLYFILNGLELAAADPAEWREKAERYRKEAKDLFTYLKENGGIPLDINRTQTVSQAELEIVTPFRLRRG